MQLAVTPSSFEANTMTRAEVEKALAAAVDAESAVGMRWGWPVSQMAQIAFRRWSSFERRHRTRKPTDEQRIKDLAKGLQAHFEPDVPYTPMSEWLHLARLLAGVLRSVDTEKGTGPAGEV